MNEKSCMELAIEKAREGIEEGQTPFGAVIIQEGKVVASAHNTVWEDGDPTAHAEVNAIREACAKLGTISLKGCVLFTTCEPCPMCLSSIHWAKIDKVVFGAEIEDAKKAGFSELEISANEMVTKGGSPLKVESGLCRDTCRTLFSEWLEVSKGHTY